MRAGSNISREIIFCRTRALFFFRGDGEGGERGLVHFHPREGRKRNRPAYDVGRATQPGVGGRHTASLAPNGASRVSACERLIAESARRERTVGGRRARPSVPASPPNRSASGAWRSIPHGAATGSAARGACVVESTREHSRRWSPQPARWSSRSTYRVSAATRK